jgi:hypothetical protein
MRAGGCGEGSLFHQGSLGVSPLAALLKRNYRFKPKFKDNCHGGS